MTTTATKPSLNDLAKRMQKVRAQLDKKEEEAKELRKEWDNIRKVQIPDKMAEAGVESVRLKGIGTISLRADAYCSVRGGMLEELQQWLVEQGAGELIKETVNSSTLKAFIKERFEQGEEIPDELVNFQPFTYATILGGK